MKRIWVIAVSEFYLLKRYPLNLFFNIIASLFTLFPLVFVSLLFTGSSLTGINSIWVISGSLIWVFLSQACWSTGLCLRTEMERGTLEQLCISPSNLIFIILGKSLINIAINFLTLVLGIFFLLLFFETYFDIKLLFLVLLVGLPSIYGFSFIVSMLVLKFNYVLAVMQVIVTFLLILSGVSQPISELPRFLQIISEFIVFERLVMLFRSIIIYEANFSNIYITLFVVMFQGLILCGLSVIIFIRFQKKILKAGVELYGY